MKFVTDGMLGKLSRWLRILGHDVKYFNDKDDDQLIEIALEEKRVLLTRDYQLFRKASVHGVEAFFIQGQTEPERLAELAERFHIKLEVDIQESRCPKCNAKINPVSKDEIREKIPNTTSRFYDNFWICSNCGQIYWQGSHWKKINNTLLQAKRVMGQSLKSELRAPYNWD